MSPEDIFRGYLPLSSMISAVSFILVFDWEFRLTEFTNLRIRDNIMLASQRFFLFVARRAGDRGKGERSRTIFTVIFARFCANFMVYNCESKLRFDIIILLSASLFCAMIFAREHTAKGAAETCRESSWTN
jgi:hypothetical protein